MMRVGINGMGRIGRLALRAAMGGLYRAEDDPRGAIALMSSMSTRSRAVLRPPRICWNSIAFMAAGVSISASKTIAPSSSAIAASDLAPHQRPDGIAWGDLGCDIVLECTGKFLKHGTA